METAKIREANGGNRPDILWIMMDHVTFRHYKMTQGARPILHTYERLASKGMEFTNCKSVHPLCMPARASMMTGVYSHHHGKINNGKHPDAPYPLYSEYLFKLGYKVGYFGKNHSGYTNLQEKGIEGFFPPGYGNPYLTEEYKQYLAKNDLGNPIFHQEWGSLAPDQKFTNGDYDLTVENNFNTYSAGYLKTPGPVHEADFLLSLAMDWITERKKQDQPYVARVEMWGPHHSYQVPLEFKDTINEKEIEEYPSFRDEMPGKPQFSRDFLQNIRRRNPIRSWEEWQPVMKRAYENYSYIDQAVGKFLDQLEQAGMADNTIVIMTADHGDALGSHGGMVDKSGDMMEELMHIPMVVRWPGVTKGTACDALVSNLDLVPTVLDLAGVELPDYMDGKSFASLLQGDRSGEREDFMAEHYGHFKVHAAQRTLYWRNYKYIATDGDVHELYDLEKDPFEMANLVDQPEMKGLADELRQRLLGNMERYGDSGEDTASLRNAVKAML